MPKSFSLRNHSGWRAVSRLEKESKSQNQRDAPSGFATLRHSSPLAGLPRSIPRNLLEIPDHRENSSSTDTVASSTSRPPDSTHRSSSPVRSGINPQFHTDKT